MNNSCGRNKPALADKLLDQLKHGIDTRELGRVELQDVQRAARAGAQRVQVRRLVWVAAGGDDDVRRRLQELAGGFQSNPAGRAVPQKQNKTTSTLRA